jgi:hypothetical protein
VPTTWSRRPRCWPGTATDGTPVALPEPAWSTAGDHADPRTDLPTRPRDPTRGISPGPRPRVLRDRSSHPPGAHSGSDRPSIWAVGHSDRPQPGQGSGRPDQPVPLPHPRPGYHVHPAVRPRSRQLGRFPPQSSQCHRGLRLLHRHHAKRCNVLRLRRHRARPPPRPRPLCYRTPERRLGHTAGQKPRHGPPRQRRW